MRLEKQITVALPTKQQVNNDMCFVLYSKAATDTKLGLLSRGCKCKRTKCLKKYCECFQANALCSGNCKCINCENVSALGATNRHNVGFNTPDNLICAPQSSLQVYRRRRYRELLPEASELYYLFQKVCTVNTHYHFVWNSSGIRVQLL